MAEDRGSLDPLPAEQSCRARAVANSPGMRAFYLRSLGSVRDTIDTCPSST